MKVSKIMAAAAVVSFLLAASSVASAQTDPAPPAPKMRTVERKVTTVESFCRVTKCVGSRCRVIQTQAPCAKVRKTVRIERPWRVKVVVKRHPRPVPMPPRQPIQDNRSWCSRNKVACSVVIIGSLLVAGAIAGVAGAVATPRHNTITNGAHVLRFP